MDRSTGQVAKLLGVPEHRIQSLIRYGLIAEPQVRAGRRVWTDQNVREARAVIAARDAAKPAESARPA